VKKAAFLCAGLLLLAACGKAEPLARIDGRDVPEQYIEYALELSAVKLVSGEPVTSKEWREGALRILAESFTAEKKATEMNLALSESDIAAINADMADVTEHREAYRFFNYEYPILTARLIDALYGIGGEKAPGANELDEFYADLYVGAAYLYFSLTDDDGVRLVGEDLDRMRAVARKLRDGIAGGEDFYEQIKAHGQDYAMALSPRGYAFPKDLFGPDVAETLQTLGHGEISEVVETPEGLFIIALAEDCAKPAESDLLYEYKRRGYTALLDEWVAAAKVEASAAFWKYGH
jgi:hypothetical protein